MFRPSPAMTWIVVERDSEQRDWDLEGYPAKVSALRASAPRADHVGARLRAPTNGGCRDAHRNLMATEHRVFAQHSHIHPGARWNSPIVAMRPLYAMAPS